MEESRLTPISSPEQLFNGTILEGKEKYTCEFHKFEAPVQEGNIRLDQKYRFGSYQHTEGEINQGEWAKEEENRVQIKALGDDQ